MVGKVGGKSGENMMIYEWRFRTRVCVLLCAHEPLLDFPTLLSPAASISILVSVGSNTASRHQLDTSLLKIVFAQQADLIAGK